MPSDDDQILEDLTSRDDRGVSDDTMASTALDYSISQEEFLQSPYSRPRHIRPEEPTQNPPRQVPSSLPDLEEDFGDGSQDARDLDDLQPHRSDALAYDEVAAVNADREFYVSDMPSPYLSMRQAQEDVQKTKRRHSLIVTIWVIICVLLAIGGAGWFVWNFVKSGATAEVESYETTTIEEGEFIESVETTALAQPIEERTVLPTVSGTVREVLVANGAVVAEGDPLFILENPSVTEALTKAQETYDSILANADGKLAALNEANDAVNSAQTALDEAQTDAERISAQAALNAAQTLSDTARIESEAAETTLQTVKETLDQAQAQQDSLTVRAPVAGTVDDLNQGATPSANVTGSTRLCSIANLSSYRIQIEVPANSRSRVNEGQEVRLTFPSIPDLKVTSSIATIEDRDEIHVATVLIPEPDEHITKGIAVEASIIVQSVPDALMVPNEALRIAKDGSAHLDVLLDPTRGIHSDVPVSIVAQDATHAAVKASNIQAGNPVILQVPSDE